MKIKFCGAARTVTGSSHLLTLDDGYKILLDCGLYQGNESDYKHFNEEWEYEPSQVDCLILSHAHIDHSGRIPKLVKDGYNGPIICTHATSDLCGIMLLDSAFIQERDAEFENKQHYRRGKKRIEPLYTSEDARASMAFFESKDYEKWIQVREGVEVIFKDSGHILGSASVTLKIDAPHRETVYLGFTGDIGRPHRPILKNPVQMQQVDYLICESTYGARLHEEQPKERLHLLNIIEQTCVQNKGKLLIPAFSVGRTQEIVYMLDKLQKDNLLPNIPVYVDSPLAVNATDIYRAHPECFDKEIMDHIKEDPNPFGFNHLHYITDVEDSKALNEKSGPCIIISASGMMEGGRIRHHIFNNCEDARNMILIVGYAAEHTLGGRIRNGARRIHLFGQEKEIRCGVEIMDSFSAHGDQQEMIDYLNNQSKKKLKHIFLVHGEYDQQVIFREKLFEEGYRKIDIPVQGESFKI